MGLGLLVLIYFAAFWKLDSWPILQWDESRFAINALEMAQSGSLLVPSYQGEADLWNSKPPLTALSQSFWMRLLGPVELAVRLPSALAALMTLLLLAGFARRILASGRLAVLVVMAMLAIPGYWGIHIARTGDADALLVCWQSLYILAFYAWLQRPMRRYLWLFAAGLLLAGLTKGIAAYLPLPALGIFALLSREGRSALLKYQLYIFGGLALGLLAAFYLYRDFLTPGYLEAVQYNEWGGRFLREEGGGQAVSKDWGFYFDQLTHRQFFPLCYFFPLAALLGILSKNAARRQYSLFSLLLVASLLFLLSASRTHHSWYDAPLFPALAMLTAVGALELYERMLVWKKAAWLRLVLGLAGLCLFAFPYSQIIRQNSSFERVQAYEAEGKLLKDVVHSLNAQDSLWVVKAVSHVYHWDQLLFYQKSWKERGGPWIAPVQEVDSLRAGYYVSCEAPFWERMEMEKRASFLRGWRGCGMWELR